MPLKTNSTLTFIDYQMVSPDNQPLLGVRLHFVCLDPGPEQPSDYFVLLTTTELAAVTTQLQLRNLVQGKLNEQIRATGIATKLDPFIGQNLVV